MRIGLVCPYSFDVHGGVQNHVVGLARHLRAAGHDPHILAPGEPASLPRLPGIPVTTAGTAVGVPYNGSVARVNFGPLSASRVTRWLRRHRFDLLHIHEPITPSISLLALFAADAPVVATFHTATPRSRTMQVAGGALSAAIEKIDAGIAVSDAAREVVVQHLGRDAVVIPNGFDHAAFARAAAATPRRGPAARPTIAFLGRLDEPRKGLGVLLAALPAIRDAVGEVEVLFAGQGSAPLPPGCRSLGAVDDAAKLRLLAGADVFVAPHLARESFGIVLLEAMAAGTAVVASALPAFAAILEAEGDVRLGRLAPVGDAVGLAAAIADALRHPDGDQIRQAQRRVRAYDWSRVGGRVLEVYRAALTGTTRDHPALLDPAGANRARLDRACRRAERTWAMLDAALVRRAERSLELAGAGTADPVLAAAAATALAANLTRPDREAAETALSHALQSRHTSARSTAAGVAAGGESWLEAEQDRVVLARRLHNDAVSTVLRLRRRPVTRILGRTTRTTRAAEPRAFEMVDAPALPWAREPAR